MLVIATAKGFFGQYRNEGDEFDAPEGAKASWFVEVRGAEPPAETDMHDEGPKRGRRKLADANPAGDLV